MDTGCFRRDDCGLGGEREGEYERDGSSHPDDLFDRVWAVDEEGSWTDLLSVYDYLMIYLLQRLALRRQEKSDENHLVQPLLDIMAEHKLDFHATFRKLSFFKPSLLTSPAPSADPNPNQNVLEKFISDLLNLSPEGRSMDHTKATNDWMAWLEKYARRILSERDEWTAGEDWDSEREKAAKAANPRFVLRQWVLEEVIKKVEIDAESGKKILGKVLQVRMTSVIIPLW
jgi:uncharacterized protein YdiU (UPF0061 family)